MSNKLVSVKYVAFVGIVATAVMTIAFSSGANRPRSGFNGDDCTDCHTGTVNTGPGSIEILNAPSSYTASEVISFQVRVNEASSTWGFQASVRDDAGTIIGTVSSALDSNTQTDREPDHIGHNTTSTNMWTVQWTAPSTVVPTTIYAAGVAGDGGGSGGDNTYTTTHSMSSLPVELVAFNGVVHGNAALLSWRTESETGNVGFDVERATSSGGWETAGFVSGVGSTAEPTDYRYDVNDLEPGVHRFRLKQIDVSGAFSYSSELELIVPLADRVSLSAPYPNPFVSRTTVDVMVAEDQNVRVAVYDILGRQVSVVYDGLMRSMERVPAHIDGSALAGGAYFVRAEGEDFVVSQVVTLIK